MTKEKERIPNVHVLLGRIEECVDAAPTGDPKFEELRKIAKISLRVLICMFGEEICTPQCGRIYPEIPTPGCSPRLPEDMPFLE